MKFIDWFAGIGGFRRGMELAGHECVGFCEFDKYAVASYTAMHLCTQEQLDYLSTLPLKERQKEILKEQYRNGEWYANDVRTVDARSIPDADCWCFGFPCQDISVAGKQLGFTGNRSSLFFRVMYMVGQLEEEKRPSYLFIENVKNLLSVNGGWDFARLLSELDKNGYDAEWQVLNSKYFGVPQNRERCFIIGHLRGRSRSEVFPVEGTNGENYLHRMTSIIAHRNGYHRNTQVFDPNGVTETLDTGQGGGMNMHTIEVIGKTRESKIVDRTRILSSDGINNCLCSTDYKDPTKVAIPVSFANGEIKKEIDTAHCLAVKVMGVCDDQGRINKPLDIKDTVPTIRSETHGNIPKVTYDVSVEVKEATKKGYSVCRVGRDSVNLTMPGSKTRRGRVGVDMANTLDTSCNQGIFVQISENLTVYAVWYPKKQCYIAIRKLTPKEYFRLQGWTDDYFNKAQMVNSDSQLYKQAGNGVTVTVIKVIAERM